MGTLIVIEDALLKGNAVNELIDEKPRLPVVGMEQERWDTNLVFDQIIHAAFVVETVLVRDTQQKLPSICLHKEIAVLASDAHRGKICDMNGCIEADHHFSDFSHSHVHNRYGAFP